MAHRTAGRSSAGIISRDKYSVKWKPLFISHCDAKSDPISSAEYQYARLSSPRPHAAWWTVELDEILAKPINVTPSRNHLRHGTGLVAFKVSKVEVKKGDIQSTMRAPSARSRTHASAAQKVHHADGEFEASANWPTPQGSRDQPSAIQLVISSPYEIGLRKTTTLVAPATSILLTVGSIVSGAKME